MPTPTPTLKAEWLRFRDTCYPKGMTELQERELHQAFFAGAHISFLLMASATDMPITQAATFLAKLKKEALITTKRNVEFANRARN